MGGTKFEFDVEAFAKQFAATFVAGLQQQPEADKPAKRVSQENVTWEKTSATLLHEGDTISRKADGSYPRLITDRKVRSNGSILLGVESTDDCTGLILQPTSTVYRRTTNPALQGRFAGRNQQEPKASKPKAAKKGRYSAPATKVQLRVVFDKAAGADYGTVAVDCKSDDGIVLARKGEPLDMVLNNLRTYNKEADEIGAPIYGFSIVGRNGNAVKSTSLVAARRASANR